MTEKTSEKQEAPLPPPPPPPPPDPETEKEQREGESAPPPPPSGEKKEKRRERSLDPAGVGADMPSPVSLTQIRGTLFILKRRKEEGEEREDVASALSVQDSLDLENFFFYAAFIFSGDGERFVCVFFHFAATCAVTKRTYFTFFPTAAEEEVFYDAERGKREGREGRRKGSWCCGASSLSI